MLTKLAFQGVFRDRNEAATVVLPIQNEFVFKQKWDGEDE